MNTDQRYERRDPSPASTSTDTRASTEPSPLAVHGDPSRSEQKPPERQSRSVRWVRPSEMPGLIGSKYVRFGIDANSELAKATRRAPRTAISRVRNRVSRRGIATPELPPTHTTPTRREGLGL